MASEEEVQMLLEVTGYALGKDDARQLLKISSNNVETAIQKFFDTEPSNLKGLLSDSVPVWDQTAFGTARYGQDDPATGPSIPTFNIDYAPGHEHYPYSNEHSAAPTRPPSRANSQHSNVSTQGQLGDAPMQSIEFQETGVVGSAQPAFGPATKEHYDTSQWAMVPSSTEVIPDPIATARRRDEGQPAILKPSPRFNFLPSLIAILHSIPAYRNALLAPDVTQRNYWMGDDWWRGSPAIPARIIDSSTGVAAQHGLDILHETQRLMAFLDKSDRAYATVSSMFELDAWKESRQQLDDDDDDLLKFLLLWSNAYEAHVPNSQLDGWLRSLVAANGETLQNFVLDVTVVRGGAETERTLYDMLDDTLFTSSDSSAHILDISKVLILRLNSATTNAQGAGCRIPATLYPDRYLESNKPVIEDMFRHMRQHEDELRDIDTKIQKLKFHTPKKDKAKPVSTLKLLETTMKAYATQDGDESADPDDAAIFSQLQTLYQSVESKLAALNEQTKTIRQTISGISDRFKPIVDDAGENLIDLTEKEYPEGQHPQDAMHHPYHLCGVATLINVVYLLHPDPNSATPGAQQWWRVQYDTETSSPTIRRDPLSAQEVLERAATESSSPLLVYAHADATTVPPIPLSKPLDDFVKKDGLTFMEELQKATVAGDWGEYDTINDSAQGAWNADPPDYEHDWTSMSAQDFHRGTSSTTLTPNTEIEDGVGVREMVEVNGGMDAAVGIRSRGSSATVEGGDVGERMDVDEIGGSGKVGMEHGKASFTREEDLMGMEDVRGDEEPRVRHIEIAEKKGG